MFFTETETKTEHLTERQTQMTNGHCARLSADGGSALLSQTNRPQNHGIKRTFMSTKGRLLESRVELSGFNMIQYDSTGIV